MQITGMLYGSKLLQFAGFPTAEVLGPDASEEAIKALIERHGSVFVKPVFKGGVGKKGKAGLLGRAKDLKTALQGEGAALLRRAPPRQPDRQGERRDVRGRGSRRARGLFLDHRLDALSRADDDAHASRRHGHRGARQEPRRERPVRPADRPQGLRRRQCAVRAQRAEGAHLAAGAAAAQAVGALSQLRHDDARAQSDPHAPDRQGRLTPVACDFKCGFDRDDPRWQRLDLPGASVRRRLLRLRAGDQPAAHVPGPERRLRDQPAAARSSRRPSAAAPIRW